MRLDPRQRRTVAVGAAAIAGIVMVGRVLPALHRTEEAAIQREIGTRLELERVRQLLSIAAVSDTTAARSRITGIESTLFHGETPAAAAGALAAVLEQFARQTGLEISASVVSADTTFSQRFAPISARLIATANAEQLARWLALVEDHQLLLRVDAFTIANATPTAAPDQSEALRLDLTIGALAIRSHDLTAREP